MSDAVATTAGELPPARPQLDHKAPLAGALLFLGLLLAGIAYMAYGLNVDISESGTPPLALGVFVLLGLSLLIALGFEFVNGFHDTANAVATVIYTHAMPANLAVVYSGCLNLIGVVTSSGAVAFAVISLLPVELILQAGSSAGFAMIFALLIAAIIWNLGTWALGIPNSSSHTLIGSIIGVGIANQIMAPAGAVTSGVDWGQAAGVFRALLFSPVVGFVGSAVLLLVMKFLVRKPSLYTAPDTSKAPPLLIRGLLILTCGSVSFAHGSNDGQKGMGLIMLILIGAMPTAYALNRATPTPDIGAFVQAMDATSAMLQSHGAVGTLTPDAARKAVENAVRTRDFSDPATNVGIANLARDIGAQVGGYGAITKVPAAAVSNVRNEMYIAGEAVRLMPKAGYSDAEKTVLANFKKAIDSGTRYIPFWVKVSVAIALGLGTMVGWKRIVVTVGEKIGKAHLTYGQGASAEMVAAGTILLADVYGLPVSTTHVLSSGVAGTMAANGSGLQWSTVRSLAHGLGAHAAGRYHSRRHAVLYLPLAPLTKRRPGAERPLDPITLRKGSRGPPTPCGSRAEPWPSFLSVPPQNLRQEHPQPLRLRILEHLAGRIALHDLAAVHEHHPVRHLPRKPHLVRHAHHGHAGLGQRDHGVQHLLDHLRIKRRGRLVEQHDLRLHAQRPRDRHPLLLAAGQLAGIFLRLLGNFHPAQIVHRQRFRLGPRRLAHPDRRQHAVLQHGQMREQVERLEHHADFAPDRVERVQIVGQFGAVHHDAAFLVALQPVDAADHGGLARAGGSAHHHPLARPHRQRHVAQHMHAAVPFVDPVKLDSGGGIAHAADFLTGLAQRARARAKSRSSPRLYFDMAKQKAK